MVKYACPLWLLIAAANFTLAWAWLTGGDWAQAFINAALGVAAMFVAALSWKRAHARGFNRLS